MEFWLTTLTTVVLSYMKCFHVIRMQWWSPNVTSRTIRGCFCCSKLINERPLCILQPRVVTRFFLSYINLYSKGEISEQANHERWWIRRREYDLIYTLHDLTEQIWTRKLQKQNKYCWSRNWRNGIWDQYFVQCKKHEQCLMLKLQHRKNSTL